MWFWRRVEWESFPTPKKRQFVGKSFWSWYDFDTIFFIKINFPFDPKKVYNAFHCLTMQLLGGQKSKVIKWFSFFSHNATQIRVDWSIDLMNITKCGLFANLFVTIKLFLPLIKIFFLAAKNVKYAFRGGIACLPRWTLTIRA